MSNRERIARAAEEARLAAAERAARKPEKKPSKSEGGGSKRSVRMKIVWDVCNANGVAVKTFPYPEKEAAEAATESLTRSTGRTHVLRPTKVPME